MQYINFLQKWQNVDLDVCISCPWTFQKKCFDTFRKLPRKGQLDPFSIKLHTYYCNFTADGFCCKYLFVILSKFWFGKPTSHIIEIVVKICRLAVITQNMGITCTSLKGQFQEKKTKTTKVKIIEIWMSKLKILIFFVNQNYLAVHIVS